MRRRSSAFDAIVVGGGHNGLMLALWLQRSGLQTLVLEATAQCGGLATSDEALLPGFIRNPHANHLAYLEAMPGGSAAALATHGLLTVKADAQQGIAFSDGRPPVVIYGAGLEERSQTSIACHSARDAETFLQLQRRARSMGDSLIGAMYRPPSPALFDQQREAFDHSFASLGLTSASIGTAPAVRLIDQVFESDEMRSLAYLLADEFGAGIDAPGGAAAFLTTVLWQLGSHRLPVGGMRSFADSLERLCHAKGVTVERQTRVAAILIDGGQAVGVATEKKDEITAGVLVASAIPVTDTYQQLIGQTQWSADERRDLTALQAANAPSLAKATFCLREPPRYRSARWNVDIDRCAQVFVGLEEPATILARARDVARGALPEPAGFVSLNTLFDSSQAPAGAHVASVDVVLPHRDALEPQVWSQVAATFNAAFCARWRTCAPNIGDATVLASSFDPPSQSFERRILLRMGAAQYKTAIERLYLCGPGTYPGGGIHGACGYNAYQVIANDLDIEIGSATINTGGT